MLHNYVLIYMLSFSIGAAERAQQGFILLLTDLVLTVSRHPASEGNQNSY